MKSLRPAQALILAIGLGLCVESPAQESGSGGGLPSLDPAPLASRAIAAMRAQQWKAARTSWEGVLKLEPENAAALSNLGKVQYQLGEFENARESLEKATRLKPELVDSWLTLGQVYLELKAPMMAVSATTRGVAENPADARSHNTLAIVLKRIGWTNGTEAELQKALDLNPEYAEAHFNLAVLYLERKPPSLEMAGRHYRKARALGAEPDPLVEKQIRGESNIEEAAPGETSDDETMEEAGETSETKPAVPPKKSVRKPTQPPRKSSPP
ncbi:MAG: repeat protein [Verrucomicrobiales bacterium]|nr:repeat protein [Verrucomicrobiales bacterium]